MLIGLIKKSLTKVAQQTKSQVAVVIIQGKCINTPQGIYSSIIIMHFILFLLGTTVLLTAYNSAMVPPTFNVFIEQTTNRKSYLSVKCKHHCTANHSSSLEVPEIACSTY